MCRVNWLDPIIHFVINWVHLTLVEPEVGCYHLGCEGDVARVELRRVAVRVRMRIEMVHAVNNETTVAGSLEPSINLVVARHGGFLLCSEK
jgi:hypothetical protein